MDKQRVSDRHDSATNPNVTSRSERRARSASSGPASSAAATTRVKAYVRIRKAADDAPRCLKVACSGEKTETVTVVQDRPVCFTFDRVFDENATQTEVYEVVAKQMVDECLKGHNVCVFAYGQTGSGKTYSISGTQEDPGILPRFAADFFERIDALPGKAKIEVAYFELYKEKVFDLLSNNRVPLRVRGGDQPYLENLSTMVVETFDEWNAVRVKGLSRRATAATLVNELSSRSHAIFRITFRVDHESDSAVKRYVALSNSYFVDLAGCERATDTGGGQSISETVTINASLLALQKVIESQSSGCTFVNYRDSLLTRLLKECFGGDSVTALLATLSPEAKYAGQCVGTLRLASRAALVVQKPTVHIDPFVRQVKDLEGQNEQLRAELESLRAQQKQQSSWTHPSSYPCLLHVMRDASMNSIMTIEDEPLLVGAFGGAPINNAEFTVLDDRLVLKVLKDEVVRNEQFVPLGNKEELAHGDRIVIDGNRFFIALTDPGTVLDAVPSYESLKLQYVECTYPIVQDRLREEARRQFEEDDRQMKEKMSEELEELRKALEEKTKMLASTNNAARRKSVQHEIAEIENTLTDTEEFRKQLQHYATEQLNQLSTTLPITIEEQEAMMQLRTKTAAIKQMITHFGLRRQYVIRQLAGPSDTERVCVRLTNQLEKTFADLSSKEVNSLYEQLSEIYTDTAIAAEGTERAAFVLQSGWAWKRNGVGRRSVVFAAALNNSFRETAQARRSTMGMLRKSFSTRKSVIAEALELDDGDEPEPAVMCLEAVVGFMHRNEREQPPTSNTIAKVLHHIVNAQDKLEATATLQPLKSVPARVAPQTTAAIAQFWTEMNCLRDAADMLTAKNECDHIVTSVVEAANLACHDAKRWLKAYSEHGDTSTYVTSIRNYLVKMVELLGRISFYHNESFAEGERYEGVKDHFVAGVKESINEACEDVKRQRKQYDRHGNGTKLALVVVLLCDCITELNKYVAMNYDEAVAFRVLRPMLMLKLGLVTCKQRLSQAVVEKLGAILTDLASMHRVDQRVSWPVQSYLKKCQSEVEAAIKGSAANRLPPTVNKQPVAVKTDGETAA